jgi:hypothetical protein
MQILKEILKILIQIGMVFSLVKLKIKSAWKEMNGKMVRNPENDSRGWELSLVLQSVLGCCASKIASIL